MGRCPSVRSGPEARDSLEPLAGDSVVIGHVVEALVITGTVITVGGIAWRAFARWRGARQADALDLAVPV